MYRCHCSGVDSNGQSIVNPISNYYGISFIYMQFSRNPCNLYRNANKWRDHAETEDRYDYLYSADELRPVADAAKIAAAVNKRVLVYFNNHFSAKAVANAAVLRNEVGQTNPGEYEREMIERYPELNGIVSRSGLPY